MGITEHGVRTLTQDGHLVLIERSAGEGAGIPDDKFRNAGATIVSGEEVFEGAKMIVKVKEPIDEEIKLLPPGMVLFTFLHLASSLELTRRLIEANIVAIAYESVETSQGQLPILTPMSKIAGILAIQEGARYLTRTCGGKGILFCNFPGVEPITVMIIGAGNVGRAAAQRAAVMGAEVIVLDVSEVVLKDIYEMLEGRVHCQMASEGNIEKALSKADLVVGSVLVKGGKPPKVIKRHMLNIMKPGSVIIDVAIDQGGCAETSVPTTFDNPVYTVEGITHFCVANLPGCVPRTSTHALCSASLPYIREICNKGFVKAFQENQELARGVDIFSGHVCNPAVAETFGLSHTPLEYLTKNFS